jgi:preprotein translocase subunit YajC
MLNDLFLATAWAQDAAPHQPSMIEQFFPFIIIIAIFFIFVIRPQQKRAQAHKGFTETMKRGDSVLTSGGILGTIEGLTDQVVILQIADGVKIRILRSQIASGVGEELVKK